MEGNLSNDIVSEILSRLSTKDLLGLKWVCKRWNSLISEPLFLRMHYIRSEGISGLFFQQYDASEDMDFELVNYVPFSPKRPMFQDMVLSFLPEKVVLMASCNGLLCCRSCIRPTDGAFITRPDLFENVTPRDLVIYVCNPAMKEWIALRPGACNLGDTFGLAFDPFGFSSNMNPKFKVVSIQRSNKLNLYSFVVYSSETGRWTTSKAVCYCDTKFLKNMEIFVGGWLHWLTWNHKIITFNVEQELSGIIELPGPPPIERSLVGMCLGESEGHLHYVCSFILELKVWVLKDYSNPEWILKHRLPLVNSSCTSSLFSSFHLIHAAEQNYPESLANASLQPVVFFDDILIMRLEGKLFSYNFKTRTGVQVSNILPGECECMKLTVLRYSACLAAMGVLRQNKKQSGAQLQRKSKRKTFVFSS